MAALRASTMSPIELYAYRRAMHNGLPHTVPMTPMEWLGVSEEWYRLGDHWETGSESESDSMSTTCSDAEMGLGDLPSERMGCVTYGRNGSERR